MPKRILAADDSRTIRTALVYTFAKEPELDIVVVDNGQAVIEAMQRETFDMLLLDYNMPGMSGIEVCLRVTQNPQTSHIPVLLLIGQKFDASLASQAGAIGQIRKPFLTSDLIERVAELLQVSYQPAPLPMASKMGLLEQSDIAIEIDVTGSSAHLTPPPLPQGQPLPQGPPHLQGPPPSQGPPHMQAQGASPAMPGPHVPAASAPASSLVPPPLPTSQPMGVVHPAPPTPGMNYPGAAAPGSDPDMLIDDLPHEIPERPAAGRVTETPPPHHHPGSGMYARPDTRSPSTLSPQTPLSNMPPSHISPMPTMGSTSTSRSSFYPAAPVESPFAAPMKAPLPPPSYQPPASAVVLPQDPYQPGSRTPQPTSGQDDALEVLVGTPLKPSPPADVENAEELLLPLEDDSEEFKITDTPASVGELSTEAENHDSQEVIQGQLMPLTEATEFHDSSSSTDHIAFGSVERIPRVDHLQQTAVVPRVRRQVDAEGMDAPELSSPPSSEFSHDTSESQSRPQISCPARHCQLSLATPLSLHTVSMLLQFADVLQNRLSALLDTETSEASGVQGITVSCASLPTQTILTFGGESAYLRCMLPALLECFGLPETTRQEIADELLAGTPDASKKALRKAAMQTRITAHPYALALRHQIPELTEVPVQQLLSSLDQDQQVLYAQDTDLDTAEAAQTSAEVLALRDMLRSQLNVMELYQMMAAEFLPLEEIVPLNLTPEAIFLAVISYFEQRHQLPELAEAIKEIRPSFDTAPFESLSGF